MFRSIPIYAASFALAFSLGLPQAAQGEEFTTARGTKLTLPAIGTLGCGEMEQVLARIDSTRYRENAPTPHNQADLPLYHYEIKLAQHHYNECVLKRSKQRGSFLLRSIVSE